MVTLAAVLFLAAHASAEDLGQFSFDAARNAPGAAVAAKDTKPSAPNFGFLATRSGELILMRDSPALRKQVESENAAYGQSMGLRVLAGRPVLLYFWGPETLPGPKRPVPYCQACPAAMAVMEQFHQDFALDGLQVVGLGMQVNPDAAKAAGQTYSHLTGAYNPTGPNAADALGLNQLPSWALIDAKGQVFASSDKGVDQAYLTGKIQELLRAR